MDERMEKGEEEEKKEEIMKALEGEIISHKSIFPTFE